MIDHAAFRNTPYWELLADVVTFLRRHLPVTGDDDYWSEACRDANALADKFQGTPQCRLCFDLLRDILEELARNQE